MQASGGWQPAPGAMDAEVREPDAIFSDSAPGAGSWGYPGAWRYQGTTLAYRSGRIVRLLMLSALAGIAGLAGVATLAALLLPHGGLVAIVLVVLAVPVLLLILAAGTLIWVGRRAWRSGVWLEAVPMAVGMPWLGRLVWAARAVLVGKTFWRLAQRARRPLRHRAASHPEYS